MGLLHSLARTYVSAVVLLLINSASHLIKALKAKGHNQVWIKKITFFLFTTLQPGTGSLCVLALPLPPHTLKAHSESVPAEYIDSD